MTRIFTNIITDLNKNPVEKVSSGILSAEKRIISAVLGATPADTNVLILCPIPSSARVHNIELYAPDVTSTVLDNLTLFSKSHDGTYTVVADDLYAQTPVAVVPGTAAINVSVVGAAITGRGIPDMGQRVWQDAGFASLEVAPGNLYIGLTITTAGSLARLWAHIEYTQD